MDMRICFPGGKRVNATYKGFTIKTDQPIESGGEGSAPTPFDLFLASIGTCSGFYVLSFCQARNIPTEKIRLVLKAERNEETKTIAKIASIIAAPSRDPKPILSVSLIISNNLRLVNDILYLQLTHFSSLLQMPK